MVWFAKDKTSSDPALCGGCHKYGVFPQTRKSVFQKYIKTTAKAENDSGKWQRKATATAKYILINLILRHPCQSQKRITLHLLLVSRGFMSEKRIKRREGTLKGRKGKTDWLLSIYWSEEINQDGISILGPIQNWAKNCNKTLK
jgi:hypothetical protein